MRSLGRPRERPGFAAAADALLRGEQTELPEPRVEFLRWLGLDRPVVFHGSPRGDLTELSTERQSRDTTQWGDQTAVYASTDPVWAIYFAVLRRDNGWTGTRNGSLGVGRRRFYFFMHNEGSESPDRFGPGSLYVLPPDSFEAQPRPLGIVDLAHLVSRVPVTPIARIDVTPEDFPFRDRIAYYGDGEPIWRSMLRA
ncbi:MAG: hypothetical protein ABUS54_06870 [Actinomycetota bacterium]